MCLLYVGCVGQLIEPLTTLSALVHQTAYKKRHDQVAKFRHWKLAQYCGFEVVGQWCLILFCLVCLCNTWDFIIVADSTTLFIHLLLYSTSVEGLF